MEYQPDRWVMLKISDDTTTIYKVLASWYGGFAGSDSWKLNSGVTHVAVDEGAYLFHGSSGSVYRCDPASYGMSGYTSGVFNQLKTRASEQGAGVEMLDTAVNFEGIDYGQLPVEGV